MADLREGLLAPRGASEDDRDDVFEGEEGSNDGRLDATAPAAEWTHVATATLSLTMTAVGSVVLSLPATFAECGWLAGIAVLLVVALLMDVSLLFIVGAARSARANSYEDAARALLGPTGGACVEIALVCLVYGSLVSLQIIIADQVQPVASAALANAPHLPHFIAERWFITCVSTALVYPMTLAKSLSALASATTAAFFVLLFVAGAVVAEFGEKGWISDPSVVAVETSKGATPCALALPVVAMAYACHFNIVAIDRELPKTRRGKACVGKVIHASILAGAFPFYVAFATAGYLQFGADVAGDVLTEWRGRDGVMTAAQLAVAGVNALKYPLMGFSLKRAVQKQLAGLWFHRRLTPSEPSDIHDDDDDGDVADAVTRGGAVIGGGADARCAPFWAEALALLLLHASVAAVALSFGSLTLAVDVVGATCGVPVMLIVPGCMFLKAFERGDAAGAWVGNDDGSSVFSDEEGGEGVESGLLRGFGGEYVGEGLEWAACWERDARGRLVAKPRPVMRLLAWTLVFVGAVVAATGLAGVALEVA